MKWKLKLKRTIKEIFFVSFDEKLYSCVCIFLLEKDILQKQNNLPSLMWWNSAKKMLLVEWANNLQKLVFQTITISIPMNNSYSAVKLSFCCEKCLQISVHSNGAKGHKMSLILLFSRSLWNLRWSLKHTFPSNFQMRSNCFSNIMIIHANLLLNWYQIETEEMKFRESIFHFPSTWVLVAESSVAASVKLFIIENAKQWMPWKLHENSVT